MATYPWEQDYRQKQYPTRVIGNGNNDIYQLQGEMSEEKVLIGHTLQWCNDLENAYNEAIELGLKHKIEKEEYFDILVEKGIKTRPKTQEELQIERDKAQEEKDRKIMETLQNLNNIVIVLNNKVEQFEKMGGVNDGHKSDIESSN